MQIGRRCSSLIGVGPILTMTNMYGNWLSEGSLPELECIVLFSLFQLILWISCHTRLWVFFPSACPCVVWEGNKQCAETERETNNSASNRVYSNYYDLFLIYLFIFTCVREREREREWERVSEWVCVYARAPFLLYIPSQIFLVNFHQIIQSSISSNSSCCIFSSSQPPHGT